MEQVKFTPEVELSNEDRSQLAHTMATQGFAIINRIMRSEVDKFVVDLINVSEADAEMVVAKHRLSKAAAQYYQGIISRLNAESQQYLREAGAAAQPVIDPTEGLIDMGEVASMSDAEFEGFQLDQNLLEEENH